MAIRSNVIRLTVGLALGAAMSLTAAGGEKRGYPLPEHVDQLSLNKHSFEEIYGWGQKLFSAQFNSVDGSGSNLTLDPPGQLISIRYARSPRPDLPGWLANPLRPDGPQSQNCHECHRHEGGNVFVEQRDPLRRGDIRLWITRRATDLSAAGVLQMLAEQSTHELMQIQNQAIAQAHSQGKAVTLALTTSNHVNYGAITANPDGSLDTSGVKGVNPNLVILPYHLKAEVPMLRFLVSASLDQTIGMQNPERAAVGVDADSDGVVDELTVGDSTATTVFIAAQPRPVTTLELSEHLGGKYALHADQIAAIKQGEKLFDKIGCTSCHTPKLHLSNAVFQEPSADPLHRYPNDVFPVTGYKASDFGLDQAHAVKFDITANPVIEKACPRPEKNGRYEEASWNHHHGRCFMQFESDGHGGAYVYLYGDQKRHDMGPGLAEAVDEFNAGPSVWRTKELWSAGNLGPWLHDGRATTLTEAILWHGGEGAQTRDAFQALSESQKDSIIAFIKSLVVYRIPEIE